MNNVPHNPNLERVSSIAKNGYALPPRPLSPVMPKPVIVVDSEVCPRCKGTGYTRNNVPFGDPTFGKAIKCPCQVKRALASTYTWLGADSQQVEELESMTFLSFKPNDNGKAVAVAYRRAKAYADVLSQQQTGQKNAFLIGPIGVGKTHLACSILSTIRAAGINCLFLSGNQFFQRLYDRDFDENIIQRAIETPVLCLDDLDKMQIKDDGSYQKTTLFTLFNQRYLARRPVIITANEEDDWHKWLHRAVLSRLFGHAEAISVTGEDYRLKRG